MKNLKLQCFFFFVFFLTFSSNVLRSFRLKHHSVAAVYFSPAGTPVSDTVCEPCPPGYFSAVNSVSDPCQPHTNCSDLGLKTLRWGTTTSDSVCQDKAATLQCSQHHSLCQTGEKKIENKTHNISMTGSWYGPKSFEG